MKTCLVVDDGPLDRAVLKHCATRLGFSVSEASSGEEALAHCQGGFPDCILLDWEMEKMNGIGVLKAMQTMQGHDATCVLICTSNDHPSFIGHAFIQGADGYLVKPLTSEKLKTTLETLKRLP